MQILLMTVQTDISNYIKDLWFNQPDLACSRFKQTLWPAANQMAYNFFNNTIIVRLQYKSSEIEFTKLDVRTTTTDKIANFGGTFGIWAELTGCSLLGLINLLIISFKLIFRTRDTTVQVF